MRVEVVQSLMPDMKADGGADSGLVDAAANCVSEFMLYLAQNMQSVRLILPAKLYNQLIGNDLELLKELQGRHGVHIVFEEVQTPTSPHHQL